MSANDRQVAGHHYQATSAPCPHCGRGLQHWDISWAFSFDQFQYCISKYIWRRKGPGGLPLLDDLEKAKHHLEKYIEVITKAYEDADSANRASASQVKGLLDESGHPGRGYVNQD